MRNGLAMGLILAREAAGLSTTVVTILGPTPSDPFTLEETHYLSLPPQRASVQRGQSLVTLSPPYGNGMALAQRLGTHVSCLDFLGR